MKIQISGSIQLDWVNLGWKPVERLTAKQAERRRLAALRLAEQKLAGSKYEGNWAGGIAGIKRD